MRFKKLLISTISVLVALFVLTSCSFVINGGDRLDAPDVYFDSNRNMVYWETVSGADKYCVKTVSGDTVNTAYVYTSFYGIDNFDIGVYKISVKAISDDVKDTSSGYSKEITVTVTESGIESSSSEFNTTEELINEITETVIKANFTVKLKSSKVFVGMYVEKSTISQGSGVIYKKDVYHNYYLLTNNHVIYSDTVTYNTFEYTVTDCYGEDYKADIVYCNADYDLAVLKFSATETYPVLSMSTSDASVGNKVITLGQPEGQINAITFGRVQGYTVTPITVDSDAKKSNVTFEVLKHDAPIKSGSSGSVLINRNLEIVGINYASGTDKDDNFLNAYAIPITKVREFLAIKNLA